MRVGILTVQVPFIAGGAEQHARSLRHALAEAGHQAEIISVPFQWFPPDRIVPQMLAARLLDVTASSGMTIDRVIGLKFPAYLMDHPDKVLWILHQHRAAYDLWDHGFGDLQGQPGGHEAMLAIREADNRLIPAARRVFTNSRRVSERLATYNGIESEPLYHPPPMADRYACAEPEDFLLLPSRINDTKRQDLVVEALFHVRSDVRVQMIGAADSGRYSERLRQRAEALPPGRLVWTGAVSDGDKIALFSRCLAVIFVPFDEDYGYVTLEAMLSGKPVLACTDAGGVLEFVENGTTGLVSEPDPVALAECLDRIWADRALARRLGSEARARYDSLGIAWNTVVDRLLGMTASMRPTLSGSVTSERPAIDIFSPLPPLPTEIANHTVAILPALARIANVRVWTDQAGPADLDLSGVEVMRFNPDALPSRVLNRADLTIFNLGNNARFHRGIHQASQRIPGLVVLHDTCLQHFFAHYLEREGAEREYYYDLVRRTHGGMARELAEAYIGGAGGFDTLVQCAPMTAAALEGSIGAILHNEAELEALRQKTALPLYYLPLACRFGPAPNWKARHRDPEAPSRLLMFGFIGANRRLRSVLDALAAMPDRDRYRLDIYGRVEHEEETDTAIRKAGLERIVMRHGFVPEVVLDQALAEADLALNFRWPSMGEASASQLRIWAAALPALVTRIGWYAQLPADAVFAIDPERERDEIIHHLRALRRDPDRYERTGENGRHVLEAQHAPELYAQGLVAIAAKRSIQHACRVALDLAENSAARLLELGPADLARPLGGEIARRVIELTGGPSNAGLP